MKKNITVKIFAFLALFGIIASVIGTGIMIFFGNNKVYETEKVLTQEDIEKIISEGKIKITNSGSTTQTGEIE